MQINKINGNSYYLSAPANIGVFQFKDKYALLVDSGDNKQQARKIDEMLREQNLSVKYIVNTHNHIDHSGGNGYFQEHFPGMEIYASAGEKQLIEENDLFPLYLYGGKAPHELSRHFIKNPAITVNDILSPGLCKINEEKFTVIALPGHSPGQIGVATRDSVCYLGDALFSEEKIAKYSLPFLFDVAAQIDTYNTLSELDYDFYVLGHADGVYDQQQLKRLITINRSNLQEYLDLAMEILNQPKTREELLEEISILKDLQLDFEEYYFSLSTIGAMITYLFDNKQLVYQLENGKLYYYLK